MKEDYRRRSCISKTAKMVPSIRLVIYRLMITIVKGRILLKLWWWNSILQI